MSKVISEVMNLLAECNYNPNVEQQQQIDNLLSSLTESEREEMDMCVSTAFMLAKAGAHT